MIYTVYIQLLLAPVFQPFKLHESRNFWFYLPPKVSLMLGIGKMLTKYLLIK